jgi:hypothetical protein
MVLRGSFKMSQKRFNCEGSDYPTIAAPPHFRSDGGMCGPECATGMYDK